MRKKKTRLASLALLLLFLLAAAGCSGEEAATGTAAPGEEAAGTPAIVGLYRVDMTMTEVGYVYDMDTDADGNDIYIYYVPEEESEWVGTTAQGEFRLEVDGDRAILTSLDDDGSALEVMDGDFDAATGEFFYTKPVQEDDPGLGDMVVRIRFSGEDGAVVGSGTIREEFSAGAVNEIEIELERIGD